MVSREGIGGGSDGAISEDDAGEIAESGVNGPSGWTAMRSRAYSYGDSMGVR